MGRKEMEAELEQRLAEVIYRERSRECSEETMMGCPAVRGKDDWGLGSRGHRHCQDLPSCMPLPMPFA
jgi:hypothetical protein